MISNVKRPRTAYVTNRVEQLLRPYIIEGLPGFSNAFRMLPAELVYNQTAYVAMQCKTFHCMAVRRSWRAGSLKYVYGLATNDDGVDVPARVQVQTKVGVAAQACSTTHRRTRFREVATLVPNQTTMSMQHCFAAF